MPTCEQLIADLVLPALQEVASDLHLECTQDLREMFLQEITDHLEIIGRPGRNICLIEPKYAGDGPVDLAALVEYYRQTHRMEILHADPSELYLRKGEVWYEDSRVDIAYRDYEVRDLVYLEKEEGVDTKPIKTLFRENRMVSSMVGEFDHKSCWEILTDPQFANKYFSPEDRHYFRRHVLWTRLLSDRRTTDPEGQPIDLLEWIRHNQDILVIKPNRSYGGDRVLIGPSVSQGEWNAALQQALIGDETFVVQRLARISVSEFPVVHADGAVTSEPFYTVFGFAPTKYGVAILGRASQKQVVNVAQRGGMCAMLVGRYIRPLAGPGAQPTTVHEGR